MRPLIEISGLTYRYADGTAALNGVDLNVSAGETVIFFGPNGSGKTTLLLHINGLLRGAGSITVCGLRLADETLVAIRKKVGVVFQDADDQLFLPTVAEDVAYGLSNQGVPADRAHAETAEMLKRLHISHLAAKAPYHLSGGEKRKAALAGVLVMQPEILILDEPTTSLDPPAQRELAEVLNTLPQAKLITTHDIGFARAVGTRAVFLEGGRITGSGSVEELIRIHDWSPLPYGT